MPERYRDGKYVSVPLDAEQLASVESYAVKADLPLGRAVAELVKHGLWLACENERDEAARAAPAIVKPAEWDGSRKGAIVFLTNVPNEWLTEEVARRMGDGVGQEEHDAVVADLEAAKGRLAQVAAALGGGGGDDPVHHLDRARR